MHTYSIHTTVHTQINTHGKDIADLGKEGESDGKHIADLGEVIIWMSFTPDRYLHQQSVVQRILA